MVLAITARAWPLTKSHNDVLIYYRLVMKSVIGKITVSRLHILETTNPGLFSGA